MCVFVCVVVGAGVCVCVLLGGSVKEAFKKRDNNSSCILTSWRGVKGVGGVQRGETNKSNFPDCSARIALLTT